MSDPVLLDSRDRLHVGFCVIGFDWRYIYVNPAAAAHARHLREDLIGRSVLELYPGIEDQSVFEALRHCMEHREPVVTEELCVFPDGLSRWYELRIDPTPEGICVYSSDIHERKLAELAEKEQRAQIGVITWVRRTWSGMFGSRSNSPTGKAPRGSLAR